MKKDPFLMIDKSSFKNNNVLKAFFYYLFFIYIIFWHRKRFYLCLGRYPCIEMKLYLICFHLKYKIIVFYQKLLKTTRTLSQKVFFKTAVRTLLLFSGDEIPHGYPLLRFFLSLNFKSMFFV